MAVRQLLGLLGASQHRRRSKSLGPAVKRGITQLSQPNTASQTAASSTAGAPRTPYGRQYLPVAASQQLLTAGSSVSITVAAGPDPTNATRIVVINGSGGPHTPVLSGAARAAAAGTWPALPTWLFGFACGGAAATAMTYNYLNPQHTAAAAPAAAMGLRHHSSIAAIHGSSGVYPYDPAGTAAATAAEDADIQGVSFPSSSSSSSSSAGSAASGSDVSSWFGLGGMWGFLQQQLGRLGVGAAHAADNPQLPLNQQRLLPTPWEDETAAAVAAAVAAASGTAAAAAVHSPAGQDAVMRRNSISKAAAAVAPAVVHIVSAGSSGNGSSSLLGPRGVLDRPQGSGFIYDPRGFILTNAHVILGTQPAIAGHSTGIPWQQQQQGGGSSRQPLLRMRNSSSSSSGNSKSPPAAAAAAGDRPVVMVHLHDGRVFPGRCVALDVSSDLAVVAIDAPEPLPHANLGHSQRLCVGEWVVAVGSPFLLRQSVTAGIISCVERKGSELGIVSSPRTEYIQTDAAINMGNSGGPLINLDGAVIGINNMKAPAAEGLSFAIPIDTVKKLLSEISRHGHVRRPYVGITMAEVNPSRMAQLRMSCTDFPSDVTAGIVVTRVTHGSPAAAAGVQEDDVIVGLLPGGSRGSGIRGFGADRGADSTAGNLSVGTFADALKGAIGGSLDLLIVREQQQQQQHKQAGSSNGGGDGSSRYKYVTVTVKPVEAPHNQLG